MASKIVTERARPVARSTITDDQRREVSTALVAETARGLSRTEAEAAARAALDTETVLLELMEITNARKATNAGENKKRYEELRALAGELLKDGNRFFLDENGNKWFAVRRQARPVKVDLELLAQVLEENPDLLDRVAPRKVDMKAFRTAVAIGLIDVDQLVQVATIGANAPFVDFMPDAD